MEQNVERLFDLFAGDGHQLFLVGGAVRDLLRGQSIEQLDDLDFTTDAIPDQVLALLRRNRITAFDVGRPFGTVGAVLGGQVEEKRTDCQITTFRGPDGRNGTFGASLEEDLCLRDLTINSMAMDRRFNVIDPYNGQSDLAAHQLRAVGDPKRMLLDDPLRMLRVGRFVSTLGYAVDESVLEVTQTVADTILTTSPERWLEEMNKLLVGAAPGAGITYLRAASVLEKILPEVVWLFEFETTCSAHHKDLWNHTIRVVEQSDPALEQRWAALVHDVGKTVTREIDDQGDVHFHGHERESALIFGKISARFKMGNQLSKRIHEIVSNHGYVASYSVEWSDSALRRLARRLGEHLDPVLAFVRADLTTSFADRRAAALGRIDELTDRLRVLDRDDQLKPILAKGLGTVLMRRLGIEPGPKVGELIGAIEEACLDGELPIRPTAEDCVAFVKTEIPM